MAEPTEEQVSLYYFDVWEVAQMLGRPSDYHIIKHCRNGDIVAVKQGKKWMIRPDQVGVLRSLIPHCRTEGKVHETCY